jgi:diguanylate cyclase (GGDEF)-like protein
MSAREAPAPAALLPSAELAPFVGFAAAADAAVSELSRQVPGWDLWLVTCVSQDRQLVIATAGAWAEQARPGAEFSWQASFCVRMTTGAAPEFAGDVALSPVYRQAAIGPLAAVRAYLGVPLFLGDGELFGTLCAFAGGPQPDATETLSAVRLVGRMLSTILTGERATAARSAEAAAAYALADRDRATGLRNRRGFEQMLELEQGRCRRFARRCSVVLLRTPEAETADESDGGSAGTGPLARYVAALEAVSQPGDVIARVERNEFAVLAVETDLLGARALAVQLRRRLFLDQLPGSVNVVARRAGEDLSETWQRARQAAATPRRGRGTSRPPR